MDEIKILRPCHAGVARVFFPIGLLEFGGTCQYPSQECLKECYAMRKDYDETVNISEDDKHEIYRYFINKPTVTLCNKIIEEMEGQQAKILSWFASGDCIDRDIDKLYSVMLLLNELGVVQNGFTRNRDLYERILRDEKIKSIVLTVEVLESEGDDAFEGYPTGVWAVPDYKKGLVRLYHGKLGYESYGGCGFEGVKHKFKGKKIEIATNCMGCYKRKIGCFFEPDGV